MPRGQYLARGYISFQNDSTDKSGHVDCTLVDIVNGNQKQQISADAWTHVPPNDDLGHTAGLVTQTLVGVYDAPEPALEAPGSVRRSV